MKWVFLVLGIGIGVGAAHLLRDDAPERAVRVADRDLPRQLDGASPNAEEEPVAIEPTIEPSELIEVDPEDELDDVLCESGAEGGEIVVDFRGTGLDPEVSLVARSMVGDVYEVDGDHEYDQDGLTGRCMFDVPAGKYRVWWLGRSLRGRIRGRRVMVGVGR